MNKESSFWNKIARKYSQKPVPDENIYQQKLELTQNLFKPEMTVLEVGCGTGTTALAHAPFVAQIDGIDFSDAMIAIAKEKALKQNISNVNFTCQDIGQLADTDKKYDVILAHSILHLLSDRSAVIQTLHQMLRPSGHPVSSTVCLTGFMQLLKVIWPLMHRIGVFPMVYFFKRDQLLQEHLLSGFEIEHRWDSSKNNIFLIARKA